eukprot:CAMPEP_0180644832 /NCGR_PEP_ID=MMETSP1037_2-20121125/48628_1 /TAXON_ID=632150 /ORGANISM="Azadinium spinosum, Strain 3D9" /LENGTH=33 /DNA_ID= /DNA_START= /DNA_END= /DNA_ORIENTATION=
MPWRVARTCLATSESPSWVADPVLVAAPLPHPV